MADSACEQHPGGKIHHLSSFSLSTQRVCVNGDEGWQCNLCLLVLKKVIAWVCKVLFCHYFFWYWQLPRYKKADIVFMALILFYTNTSHILIKKEDALQWCSFMVCNFYILVWELFECIYLLDYLLIEVGDFVFWAHRYPLELCRTVACYLMDI